jgi:NTE family protein
MEGHMTPSSVPKLGLALGSGAARGLAHIGVLKVLEEAGISVDVIAGTSMGAFIGAMYAAGVPVAQMEQVAREIDWRRMARLLDPVVPTSGLTDGRKLVAFIAELLPARDFEDLQLDFAVTTTDIHTGEAVIIRQGNLLEALHASLAFPGIFSPVRFGQRLLVDGGLCTPIPADVTRTLGADKIICVCTIPTVAKKTRETFLPSSEDRPHHSRGWRNLFTPRKVERAFQVSLREEGQEPPVNSNQLRTPNIFRVCAQSVAIMENVINDLHLKLSPHDLLIRPKLDGITLLEFHRAEEVIAAGEEATRAVLPRIRQLMSTP